MGRVQNWLNDDLERLCTDIGARPVGSDGNGRAVEWATRTLTRAGWQVERQEFGCLAWRRGEAALTTAGRTWNLEPGPFSPPFAGEIDLVAASGADDLAARPAGGARGAALLLHGDVAREQLFPKNFPFFRMEEHIAVYEAIERLEPAAVITASPRNPELAAGSYPVPMIEDGDFTIPSAYTSAEAGAEIARTLDGTGAGRATLHVDSDRRKTTAANPIARWPDTTAAGPVVLLAAHIDTKPETPGALDNAAGVVTLLSAARLIAESGSRLPVEIALFNGEDYYSAPGQTAYLESGALDPARVSLGINVDGAGLRGYRAAWSTYDVPDADRAQIAAICADSSRLVAGDSWYQGDHAIFVQSGVPAFATTCEPAGMDDLLAIAHTPRDKRDLVDTETLADLADALARIATDTRLRSTRSPG